MWYIALVLFSVRKKNVYTILTYGTHTVLNALCLSRGDQKSAAAAVAVGVVFVVVVVELNTKSYKHTH